MAAIKEILTKVKSLNGAQRRLGNYLQNDSSALLLSNVNDLAQAVGVSKATVVRFAKTLGYSGFPELKRDIQKEMRRKLRAADRMKETFAELGDDENIFAKLIKRDTQLLQETLRAASFTDFEKAVEVILNSRKVFLIGLNASTALAYILYFRLVRVKKDAHWIFLTGGTSLVEQLAFMEPADVLGRHRFSRGAARRSRPRCNTRRKSAHRSSASPIFPARRSPRPQTYAFMRNAGSIRRSTR